MTIEDLLAQRDWLEKLAYRLVRDFDEAQDLTQEAYLSAVKSRPDVESARGWLGRVATNAARMRYRTDTRRRAREDRVVVPESPPTSFELTHKEQMARTLAIALSQLDEPYRGAVQLRFFGDMSVAEVAAEQKVPVGTAGWRISEGLSRLRRDLEVRLGDDARERLLVLAPVGFSVEKPAETTAFGNGGLTMMKLLGIVVVIAMLTAGVFLYAGSSSPQANAGDKMPPPSAQATSMDSPKPRATAARDLTRYLHDLAPSGASRLGTAASAFQREGVPKDFELFFRVVDGNEPEEKTDELLKAMGNDIVEMADVFIGCYDELFVRRPDLREESHVTIRFSVVKDSDLGPIVTSSEVQENIGGIDEDEFLECARQSAFAFKLPKDLQISSDPLTIEFGVFYKPNRDLDMAAIEACRRELQARRPDVALAGAVDDPLFAKCMDKAVGAPLLTGEAAFAVPAECLEELQERFPDLRSEALAEKLRTDETLARCMNEAGISIRFE